MSDEYSAFVGDLMKKLAKIDYIKPNEIPNIDLYMDQVTTFMNSHLSDSRLNKENRALTKTMINNYAKNDLLPPPVKKKYSREHMIVLIYIYYFKNILSISDIQNLLNPITDKFFDKKTAPTQDGIYKEVYRIIKEQLSDVSEDVKSKFTVAKKSFPEITDPENKEYLQNFAFICELAFDVYLKKQMIESMIEEMSVKPEEVPAPVKEKEKDKVDKDKKK